MDFAKKIKKRKSNRKFISKGIEDCDIKKILEAARISPSASNSQPWTFVVVQDENLRDKAAQLTYGSLKLFNKFVSQANIIISIVQGKKMFITEMRGRIKGKDYALIDIGLAAQCICLQATELGIGICRLGWFDEIKIKKLLNVHDKKIFQCLLVWVMCPIIIFTEKRLGKNLMIL